VDYFFIGDAELATAFRFVGIGGISVSEPKAARDAFRRLTLGALELSGTVLPDAEYGTGTRVLILTEEVADSLGEELSEWQISGKYPLIVELPGLQGRLKGRKTLVDAIRDAIGIRV